MVSTAGPSSVKCPSETSGGLDAPHPAIANSPNIKLLFIILVFIDLPSASYALIMLAHPVSLAV
jgi:hypothetical protein